MKRTRGQWAVDAEKATGLKWDELSLFDKIQWQKRYAMGRIALNTPKTIRAYGRDRFDERGKDNGDKR